MNFELARNCPDCGESFPLAVDPSTIAEYLAHRAQCKAEGAMSP